MDITKQIATELQVRPAQVEAAVKLLDEGIPAIEKRLQADLMTSSYVLFLRDLRIYEILKRKKLHVLRPLRSRAF